MWQGAGQIWICFGQKGNRTCGGLDVGMKAEMNQGWHAGFWPEQLGKWWYHSLRWEIWAGNPGFLCFCSLLFCGGLGGGIPAAQNSSITCSWITFSLWAQTLFTSLNCGKVGKAQLHFCAGFATSCIPALLQHSWVPDFFSASWDQWEKRQHFLTSVIL